MIRSDRPFALEVSAKTTDGAVGEYLRRLHASGIVSELTAAELKILQALLLYSNGQCLAETHCLVAWPSIPRLARELGLGRSIAHLAVKQLIETHGLVRRLAPGTGGKSTTYQLIPPPEPDPGRPTVQPGGRSKGGRRDSHRARWSALVDPDGQDAEGATVQSIGRSARAPSDAERPRPRTVSARATGRTTAKPHIKEARARAHARQEQIPHELNSQEQQQPMLPFGARDGGPAAGPEDAVVVRLLTELRFGDESFDRQAVQQMARYPGICEQAVRDALAEVRQYRGHVEKPLGLYRATLKRVLGQAPPRPPRLPPGTPEHVREEVALDFERGAGARAADQACRTADRRLVDSLTPPELAAHVEAAIAEQPSEVLRQSWRKKGLNSPTLLATVAARVRDGRRGDAAGATPGPSPPGGPDKLPPLDRPGGPAPRPPIEALGGGAPAGGDAPAIAEACNA